eukprot:g28363.t1
MKVWMHEGGFPGAIEVQIDGCGPLQLECLDDFKLWLSNLKLKISLDASFFSPLVPVFVPSGVSLSAWCATASLFLLHSHAAFAFLSSRRWVSAGRPTAVESPTCNFRRNYKPKLSISDLIRNLHRPSRSVRTTASRREPRPGSRKGPESVRD